MTKEKSGLSMLAGAERFLWTLIPEKSFPEEYPVEAAAIRTLQTARQALARELRISSSTTEKQN
jgi:hypothetical protein